jgi:hypothetical protein
MALPAMAFAEEMPCVLGPYKMLSVNRVAFDCARTLRSISGTATIRAIKSDGTVGNVVADGPLTLIQDANWFTVTLATPIAAGADFEITLQGTANNQAFDASKIKVSTKPDATISVPIRQNPSSFRYGRELWLSASVEVQFPPQLDLLSEDAPGVFVPHRAEVFAERSEVQQTGTARLTFKEHDAPKQLNSRMKIDGLKNVLGQDVRIKLNKRLAPASSPKDKDSSTYYAKLLHQAGMNSKPAFILDGKAAPVFPIASLRDIQLRPSATSDIGQGGAIGKTKTNDLIQFSFGIGRFVRTEHLGIVQGVDPTAGFTYETNYELAHKNALLTSEAQWLVAGTYEPLKEKNFVNYVKQRNCDGDFLRAHSVPCDKSLQPQDAVQANFGYELHFYTGIETGSQISVETGKASSGSSKVNIPKYSIARLYPKVSIALDLTHRFALTMSGTGRYLFATENVYREHDVLSTTGGDPTKQVYLTTVSGFRPSGEVGLAFALDDAGHYALSSAVKVGSLPPNFVRVATVQTGLTVKF